MLTGSTSTSKREQLPPRLVDPLDHRLPARRLAGPAANGDRRLLALSCPGRTLSRSTAGSIESMSARPLAEAGEKPIAATKKKRSVWPAGGSSESVPPLDQEVDHEPEDRSNRRAEIPGPRVQRADAVAKLQSSHSSFFIRTLMTAPAPPPRSVSRHLGAAGDTERVDPERRSPTTRKTPSSMPMK